VVLPSFSPQRSAIGVLFDLIPGLKTMSARKGGSRPPCWLACTAVLPMGSLLPWWIDDRPSVLTHPLQGGLGTKSFQQLEASQDTRTSPPGVHLPGLEQHHLAMARRPGQLVSHHIKKP